MRHRLQYTVLAQCIYFVTKPDSRICSVPRTIDPRHIIVARDTDVLGNNTFVLYPGDTLAQRALAVLRREPRSTPCGRVKRNFTTSIPPQTMLIVAVLTALAHVLWAEVYAIAASPCSSELSPLDSLRISVPEAQPTIILRSFVWITAAELLPLMLCDVLFRDEQCGRASRGSSAKLFQLNFVVKYPASNQSGKNVKTGGVNLFCLKSSVFIEK